jgi:flagellar FliL protein
MVAEVEEPDEASADEGEATAPAGKAGRRKLIIVAAGVATLLIGGGGGYALLGHKATKGEAAKASAAAEHGEGDEFIDVPSMVVNMRSPDGATRFVKVHFMLVPAEGAKGEEIKKRLPLLLDAFQSFLRELRPEDLAGSAAIFRIKEELLVRARDTLGPNQVQDILIQDLIQQ